MAIKRTLLPGGSRQDGHASLNRYVMSLQTLILFVLKASILLNVFAIGLKAGVHDATYMFRRPGKLAKALLAMNILMPLFAVAFVLAFHLKHAVEVALVALAVSPVPPILPRKLRKAGATESDTIGLLVAVGILAIVFVPAAMEILERVFHLSLIHISEPTRLLSISYDVFCL